MKPIFITIYHSNLPLYQKGIDLLEKDGFEVFRFDNLDDNYDNGFVKISKPILAVDWDIIHFIDNDCFISDIKYIKRTLKDFGESDLGFASYFENGWRNDYKKYFDWQSIPTTIAEVKDQEFISEYPFMKPSWENAMMMFKRDAWEKITDYSDMNKYLPELWEKGVRFGVKKVEPRLKYSHKGEGFFHVGNLIPYLQRIENGERIEIDEITKPRIGYFQKYHGLEGYPDFTKEWEDLIR